MCIGQVQSCCYFKWSPSLHTRGIFWLHLSFQTVIYTSYLIFPNSTDHSLRSEYRVVVILSAQLLCIPEASSGHIYLSILWSRQVTSSSWTPQIILHEVSDILSWICLPCKRAKQEVKQENRYRKNIFMVSVVTMGACSSVHSLYSTERQIDESWPWSQGIQTPVLSSEDDISSQPQRKWLCASLP